MLLSDGRRHPCPSGESDRWENVHLDPMPGREDEGMASSTRPGGWGETHSRRRDAGTSCSRFLCCSLALRDSRVPPGGFSDQASYLGFYVSNGPTMEAHSFPSPAWDALGLRSWRATPAPPP